MSGEPSDQPLKYGQRTNSTPCWNGIIGVSSAHLFAVLCNVLALLATWTVDLGTGARRASEAALGRSSAREADLKTTRNAMLSDSLFDAESSLPPIQGSLLGSVTVKLGDARG